LEEQSEAKGISPTFSKSKVKRIGLFQKFGKTKHNEVNPLKFLQDRSITNVFVPNCVKDEKRKKEASFFFGKKAKKNEYNRSSTIEDLPLLVSTTPAKNLSPVSLKPVNNLYFPSVIDTVQKKTKKPKIYRRCQWHRRKIVHRCQRHR
jgi:hypothetical protein